MMNDILAQQRFKALKPDTSSWVSASAGSGKTKILTDRVIALLLEGVSPSKILCLTFTKAAAAEMVQRIRDTLARFKTLSDEDLKGALSHVMAHSSSAVIQRARGLFDAILNSPGGLRIQTLHAFAESLLHKFPLEVGLHPHFRVIDEHQTYRLLDKAFEALSADLQSNEALYDAFSKMMTFVGHGDFKEALMTTALSRGRTPFLKDATQTAGVIEKLWRDAGLHPHITQSALFESFFNAYGQDVLYGFQNAVSNDVNLYIMSAFLTAENRQTHYEGYKNVFLTQKKEPRKKVLKKEVINTFPFLEDFVDSETARILAYEAAIARLNQTTFTVNLLTLGHHFLTLYTSLKHREAVLDFDDLIFKTCDLLRNEELAPWVLYKLDAGLEHILVDEAQDTNTYQWQVINALASEFFLNDDENRVDKTLFVVGDRKQSIYSFQQANPELFDASRLYFQKLAGSREKPMHALHLTRSYRSLKAVLDVVDGVFQSDMRAAGVEANLNHQSVRSDGTGSVSVLPLYVDDVMDQNAEPWALPVPSKPSKRAREKMIEGITAHIEETLKKGAIPSDIMILVRRRGKLMGEMVAALKNKKLPVSGVDRLILTNALVVKDVLALMIFALNPMDDLQCAVLLKSPFIGLDDDDLLAFAIGREGSLFEAFKGYGTPEDTAFLEAMIEASKHLRIYEFLCEALYTRGGKKKLLARLGYDAGEWLDELLDLALQFENDALPSLEHFIAFVQSRPIELKRDLSGTKQNRIRVMTIHGAKGLEANHVYLIDTTTLPRPHGQLLVFDDEGVPYKTSLNNEGGNAPGFDQALKAHHATLNEEYNRLLYVALTRAREHLVIAGCSKEKDLKEGVWFKSLAHTVQALGAEDDQGLLVYGEPLPQKGSHEKGGDQKLDLPPWLLSKTVQTAQVKAVRPADHGDRYVQQRGTVMHKMLELWAFEIFPPFERAQKIFGDIKKEDLHQWYDSVGAFLAGPLMQGFKGRTVLKEVPVEGFVHGVFMRGVIDALMIEERRVLILDYKTEKNPPSSIPEAYRAQLLAYQKLIQNVYPTHKIEAAVVWTEKGNLTYV